MRTHSDAMSHRLWSINMATFKVTMTYVGRHTYEIEANNADDAEQIALYEVAHCADFESGYFEVETVAWAEPQDLS